VSPVEDDQPVLKSGSDPDILEIYLEEAEEESENIRQLQQDWKFHSDDNNALNNIRRAFHTIKGSGRLVGAMKIGEFAWDFENLLNRVIEQSVQTSEQIIDAVGLAANALPELVEELKNHTPVHQDIAYLRGLARALSEFNPGQVLEFRQSVKQEPESKQESPLALATEPLSGNDDAENEHSPEDAEHSPAESASSLSEVDVSTDPGMAHESITSAPEHMSVQAKDAHQTEETPPDPFVSSAMVDMPGREVDSPMSEAAQTEDELEESTALQIGAELLVIYQQEVESHLNTVNSALDQAQQEQSFKPSEALYRALHTIHGASRTADISSIGELAGLLEKPLKFALEKSGAFDQEVLELYRRGAQQIHTMTDFLVQQRQLPELAEDLQQDLQTLMEQMDNHTVELPAQVGESSNQFIDTLTMMNETVEPDYDDELVDIFIEEAVELLDMSDLTLQSWVDQDETDDSVEFDLVMELQRYLHTLKGGAKMADFSAISDLSHELESLFIAIIDNRVEKTDELVDLLHESFDLLSAQVEQARQHEAIDAPLELLGRLKRIRSSEADSSREELEAPELEQAEAGESTDSAATDDASHKTIAQEIQALSEASTEAAAAVKLTEQTDRRKNERDVVRVRSDLLDNLVSSAGEVSIYRARMEQQVSHFGSNLSELGQTISRLKNQLRALEAETDAQIHFSHKEQEQMESFDPLEMDRYTQIQELSKSLSESVDDLSSLQSILGEQVKDSETLLLQQSRINTDLQDGLIRSRMVRFTGLVSRLRRLVRKTCSELAKKAELVIEGDEHEVDIKVLDRMLAPIEHILRNSITHGIEKPIDRLNKGKPETGVITIKISRDGSDIVLKISDDGAGVNVRKVHARAIELGLLEEHEEVDDIEVMQFILEPGFSTAEQVTQVAGRGVGMDVVASSIKQLGGTLQIETSSQGTIFTARLPFTLSINQAILVQAGDESFALPLINIEGITRIEADQMVEFYQQEKPSLDYAGQRYQLHYLQSLLDNSKVFRAINEADKVPVILLRSGDLRVALHIDELLGNREIVVKPLGKLMSQVKGISGASILADGRVVLILDINELIRHGVATLALADSSEQPVVEKETTTQHKLVMVVDDSITMRRVASKLLTRNHYDVVTAKDGVDALAQLQDVNPDVMLLDIEMPRMDGFELAMHMKNEADYRNIPIIMITSRTGNKHRDHAMKIGVDQYMGKPYQEEELINNIAALVG